MARPEYYSRSVSIFAGREQQRGYIMVISMLIILLITVMSITMAKSFFQEEGMASNLREKSRSFAAAQAGLRYAESVAATNGITTGGTCATSGALAAQSICNNAYTGPASYAVTPLPAYWSMPQPAAAIATFSNTPTTDTFYATPGIYIQYVGYVAPASALYKITVFGYGSTANSISEVESRLQVSCKNGKVTSGGYSC